MGTSTPCIPTTFYSGPPHLGKSLFQYPGKKSRLPSPLLPEAARQLALDTRNLILPCSHLYWSQSIFLPRFFLQKESGQYALRNATALSCFFCSSQFLPLPYPLP